MAYHNKPIQNLSSITIGFSSPEKLMHAYGRANRPRLSGNVGSRCRLPVSKLHRFFRHTFLEISSLQDLSFLGETVLHWSILTVLFSFVDLHTGYLEATKISQQNWGPQRIQGFPALKNGGTEETHQKEILCLPSAEMKYVERRSELFSVWPFCNKAIQDIQNTEKASYQTCTRSVVWYMPMWD